MESEDRFCWACGSGIYKNDRFCRKCGVDLGERRPIEQGHEAKPEDSYTPAPTPTPEVVVKEVPAAPTSSPPTPTPTSTVAAPSPKPELGKAPPPLGSIATIALHVIGALGWLWAFALFVAGSVNLTSGFDSLGVSNRVLLETASYLLIGVGPGVIVALLCGMALRRSRNRLYERAIQDYDEAIRLNPQDAIAYNNRGVAYGGLGQYERAIQDYDEAIRLNPQDAKTYYNRGVAYDGPGQYERAIQDYDEAIHLDPQNAHAYHERGVAYGNLGKRIESDRDIQKAIEFGYLP